MIRLRSAAKHIYNGKVLFPGQEFEALTEQDASDLIALHFAEPVVAVEVAPVVAVASVEPVVVGAATVEPVVVAAVEPAIVDDEPEPKPKRRIYRRRDLKAEE